METYKIEKGIPIPKVGRTRKYPFQEMEIGDSFLYDKEFSRENMTLISNAARAWSNKGNYGYKFTVHKTEDNKIRIWRVK